MSSYPSTLPLPEKAQHAPKSRLFSSDLPGKPSNIESSAAYCETMDIEFFFNSTQVAEFAAWWKTSLVYGGAWFNCAWPAVFPGSSSAQFLEEPTYSHVYNGAFRVSAKVQVRPSNGNFSFCPLCRVSGPAWQQSTITTGGSYANNGDLAVLGSTLVSLSVAAIGHGYVSTDAGRNWTLISVPSREWKRFVGGDSGFVAVASNNSVSQYSAYSPDGFAWTASANMPSSAFWYSLGYGNGKFLAPIYGGTTLAVSINGGQSWSSASMPVSGFWRDVAYGGSVWLAVLDGNTAVYRSVNDGVSFAAATSLPGGFVMGARPRLTYGDSKFVLVGSTSTNQIAHTSDGGTTWTVVTLPNTAAWNAAVWNGSIWVLPAVASNLYLWSADLVTWTAGAFPTAQPYGLQVSSGNFVGLQPASGFSVLGWCRT